MTLEQRLQLCIGSLTFQLCSLQTELEQAKAALQTALAKVGTQEGASKNE